MKKLLLFCTIALAACDGTDATGPRGNVGTLRFTHAGVANLAAGTFDARGEMTPGPQGQVALGTWAYAGAPRGTPDEMLQVFASRVSPGTTGRYDVTLLMVPDEARAGDRFTRFAGCAIGERCAWLDVSFRAAPGGAGEHRCILTSGEVRVAERTDDRVRGTFSGSATCYDESNFEAGRIAITAGSFDVPIRHDVG